MVGKEIRAVGNEKADINSKSPEDQKCIIGTYVKRVIV
jgi:hypothetical protein